MTPTTPARRGNRARAVALLPLAVLTLVAAVAVSRPRAAPEQAMGPTDDTPESCVARMLVAEKQGDSGAYLDSFDATKRAEYTALWADRSRAQIAAELRQKSAGLVGHAVTEVVLPGPDRATLVLERIEKDHTERLAVELFRRQSRWEITRLSFADWNTPSIPYGTPVFAPARDGDSDR